MDILKKIHLWSNLAPQRTAYISSDRSLGYLELEGNSDALAAYICSILPDDHSPVAVVGHKEAEMLVAILAAVKSGHPYIPIDTSTPSQRIETIIKNSGAALQLTPESINEHISEFSRSPGQWMRHELDPQDPWYIIYTSGSTGEPKGVVITRACLESFVDWMLNEQNFSEGKEIFINQAPFSFDLSVMDLYLSLVTGGTLFGITKDEISEPGLLFSALGSSNASVWVSTPSFAQMCLFEPTFSKKLLPRLHKFLFCGETLSPEVAENLLERFPGAEVWNTYGPTEATCATTSICVTKAILVVYNPLPVGVPKPDCHIQLMRADNTPCLENERGEIVIAGPNVSPGYLHQPELTEKVFFQSGELRAYRTGDLGHFDHGLLFFDGRLDHQIKLHGYRIELGDVESNLQVLPSVLEAVVLPHLKNGLPDFLAAFVILKSRPDQTEFETTRNLKRDLRKRLPDYMLPHKWYYPDKFPMTANGKIDRRKLAESLK